MKIKLLSFFVALGMIFVFSLAAFAESSENYGSKETASPRSVYEEYKDPDGKTLIASNGGDVNFFPENSIPALKKASEDGADIIKIDIKETKDGVLVLSGDLNLKRTCGVDKNISDLTYKELSEQKLLNKRGGAGESLTEYKIPSLKDVLIENTNCLYLADAPYSLRDKIYDLLKSESSLENVIFLFKDASPKEISEWKDGLSENVLTTSYFKGNIIFNAVSFLKKSEKLNIPCSYLASKVPYGVVFGKTVTQLATGKTRLMVNASEPKLSGTIREDTEVYWDDLIKRGFSVILTDDIEGLKKYLDDCESEKEKLRDTYNERVVNYTLPQLKSDKWRDYKRSYNNAKNFAETLLNKGSCAKSDLVTANYELKKTVDNINENLEELKNGTAGLTITPARVALSVLAVVAVVSAEIFVYKKKKK